jgi:tyrosyl-tRNA synthetase
MIQGGGVSINKVKVEDGAAKPGYKLLHNRYLLVQKGKKNYHLIVVS